jgi:hypothetical protein
MTRRKKKNQNAKVYSTGTYKNGASIDHSFIISLMTSVTGDINLIYFTFPLLSMTANILVRCEQCMCNRIFPAPDNIWVTQDLEFSPRC